MSTTHESCSKCGATLASGEVGEVLTCHFCGTENRIGTIAPPSPPAPAAQRRYAPSESTPDEVPAATGRGGGCVAVTAVVLVVPLIAIVLAFTRSCGSSSSSSVRKMPVNELHTAKIGGSFKKTPIDAPPVVGSIEHFDVLANLDWATAVARAWWPDAALKRLEIDPVHADGFANLNSKGAHATYKFFSAQCLADNRKRVETSAGLAPITCNLNVDTGMGGPSVYMDSTDDRGEPLVARPPCAIAEVFARLARDKELPDRPTYAMQLGANWHVTHGYDSPVIWTGVPYIHPAFCKESGDPYTR